MWSVLLLDIFANGPKSLDINRQISLSTSIILALDLEIYLYDIAM